MSVSTSRSSSSPRGHSRVKTYRSHNLLRPHSHDDHKEFSSDSGDSPPSSPYASVAQDCERKEEESTRLPSQTQLSSRSKVAPRGRTRDRFRAADPHEAKESELPPCICTVWEENFEEEVSKIEEILDDFPFVAIDTEFPGIVLRPTHLFENRRRFSYDLLMRNVNMLKIIQLGITLYNEKGERPHPVSTWQFNFKFSLSQDMYAPDSIQLLLESGLDLKTFAKKGIEHQKFAEVMTMSGLMLNDDITWICFHGAYDFAYLLKTLHADLPVAENDFWHRLRLFFPNVCDLKILFSRILNQRGGLQHLANKARVRRRGPQHTAGSDSLLTGDLFFHVRNTRDTVLSDEKIYMNILYGVGPNPALDDAHTLHASRRPLHSQSAFDLPLARKYRS